ncbi:hypothetical protein OAL54_00035 [Gammaproteobacteria bacterium]|nr:hypothetical protein [Gammaproteobacteria bacterium]|tara:strand:- start:342 stop:671 length:330 start_codon:yes stop_codon:yes gene_type:complete
MKTLYIVKANPMIGREDEFNRWYDEIHLDEVLQISGFKSAQRFIVTEQQMQPSQSHSYLAIYELDDDDLEKTLQNLREASWLTMNNALDFATIDVSVVRALGETKFTSL